MADDRGNIRKLAGTLRENLARCAKDPDVDSVHDTRTGTRRLQATLETLLRDLPPAAGDEAVEQTRAAATALMRTLKKIRRAAGPVRDLDVHRKLVGKLTKRALGEKDEKQDQSEEKERHATLTDQPDVLETPAAGLRLEGLARQADDLDAWLKHRRRVMADAMQAQAGDLLGKLDKRVEELEAALHGRVKRSRKKPPGVVALDSFARLAMEMQHLDAGNLHDFRKGAKKARYVAELAAQGDAQAQQVGASLKKLQDEIGNWHDWLVLAEEARTALGDEAEELIGLLDAEREEHFVKAMKTAAKLRGRLMGEWLAASELVRRVRRRVAANGTMAGAGSAVKAAGETHG